MILIEAVIAVGIATCISSGSSSSSSSVRRSNSVGAILGSHTPPAVTHTVVPAATIL